MRLALLLCLALAGCAGKGGVLDFSGQEFPQPQGHAKLCAEQPKLPACPGAK